MKHRDLNLSGIKRLARELYKKSGPKRRIFGLIGNLGAGKTTFTKTLAEAMGIKDAKSPTFVIVHCYRKSKKSLYHIDLYRLDKVNQLAPLGIEEMLADEDSLVAIEWVDKFPSIAKLCDTIITFEITKNNKRNVTVTNN
jgi:tRNA threonylcarbamoyladenosine biosynthesis protein TsaE